MGISARRNFHVFRRFGTPEALTSGVSDSDPNRGAGLVGPLTAGQTESESPGGWFLAQAATHKLCRHTALKVAVLALGVACSTVVPSALAATAGAGVGGAQAPGRSTNVPAPSKRGGAVKISSAVCVPTIHCSANPHQVSLRGELRIKGSAVRKGMVVAFPRSYGARIARNSPTAHISSTSLGLVVHVPSSAHSGRIMILLSHGRHSNSYGPIQVVRYALHPPSPPAAPSTVAPGGTAFDGQGMWIWYVSQSDGGNLAAIVAQAHAAGVSTLFVKSSDGSANYWSQFSPALVEQLHANGLRVCAWQYVYGTNPAGEASLGARAVAAGADCLVIDAEAEYEGKYGAAQTYIADLREKIGATYPLGLASFPYVYYHTSLPFSVFLGPNGAQFNAPQMYWKAIGNSVDTVYANTYISNRPYGRVIAPLGQTYENPSTADLLRFREEASLYGAGGISFWDFQETSASGWKTLGAPLAQLTSVTPDAAWSELSPGSKGDPVLWMQEHLASAIAGQATTGIFDSATKTNLEQFQASHAIPASGHTDAATWQALLALAPVAVDWTGKGPKG
jgi:peptidoglycan hydrolase-like protein with peptidoglycan-binding domain